METLYGEILIPEAVYQEAVVAGKKAEKVYFPRLVVPISAVISGGVDFVLAFVVLLGMMLFYGTVPTAAVVWLPLLLLLALVTSLGVGLWLTAMNVQFRDVRYAVPFLVQAWMFATPIAYPSSLLDEPWRTLYGINPMPAWSRASAGRCWGQRQHQAQSLSFRRWWR